VEKLARRLYLVDKNIKSCLFAGQQSDRCHKKMELHRYIVKQVLVWLTITVVTLIGIVWLSQALRLIELLVNKGANLSQFLVLTLLSIPLWQMIILPVGTLIATVIVLNRLQQDREITAMQSAGLNNFYILRGPLFLGFMVTGFLYINSLFILPFTFSSYKSQINTIRTSAPIVVLQEGVFTDLADGLTVYIKERNGKLYFKTIFVHDKRVKDKITEIVADRGIIDTDPSAPKLVFFNGTRSEYSLGDNRATLLNFDEYSLSLTNEFESRKKRVLDYNEMPVSDLLFKTNKSPKYLREMRAEGHYRLASPLLGLTMLILGATAILNRNYSRVGSWKHVTLGMLTAMGTLVGVIVSRGLTVTQPEMFPLIYAFSILPGVFGLIMMRERGRLLKVARP
jgi:lipopolysaccharide export system permease protein